MLPRFAADLQWLKSQGHQVERFNLAQQPAAFIQNPEVHQFLMTQGTNCLPLIVIDGRVVSRRVYPAREELSRWTATSTAVAQGCCGGPAKDVSKACCALDEQSQATSGTGCGCAESPAAAMQKFCSGAVQEKANVSCEADAQPLRGYLSREMMSRTASWTSVPATERSGCCGQACC